MRRANISVMDIAAWVPNHGSVVRTARVEAAGASRFEVARAVRDGTVRRIARGWIATPDADPLLVSAAQRGVVLTCVTEASRRGLWVLEPSTRAHVGAGAHAGRAPTATAVVHWGRPPVPRHPDALVDPIENVLAAVAACQPFEAALAVWESALQKGLASASALGRLALPPKARALRDAAEIWSDSGLETFVVPRLRWLRLPLRRQIWIEGHRVDLLIGPRLVLQIDGGTHVGRQREEDIAHDAALMLLGYHVIRVGYVQVLEHWEQVQDIIMRAIAQGLHLVR